MWRGNPPRLTRVRNGPMPLRTLQASAAVLAPFRRAQRVGMALALLLNPISLRAQAPTSSDSTRRDSVRARAYALPPVVVTASRVPTSQRDIGFATSLLGGRDLAAEPTPYAARALTFLPGVSIDEGSGPGGPTVLHLRGGEESFAQIMFDGVPINISGGFHDLQGVTLTNVE